MATKEGAIMRRYDILFSSKETGDGWYVIAKDDYDSYWFVHSGPFPERTAIEIHNALDAYGSNR